MEFASVFSVFDYFCVLFIVIAVFYFFKSVFINSEKILSSFISFFLFFFSTCDVSSSKNSANTFENWLINPDSYFCASEPNKSSNNSENAKKQDDQFEYKTENAISVYINKFFNLFFFSSYKKENDFACLLKDTVDPSNFSFMKDNTFEQKTLSANEKLEEGIKSTKDVLVMYGSEYGFCRSVASKFAREIKKLGISCCIRDLYFVELLQKQGNTLQLKDIFDCSICFIICSTQGDGVPPQRARSFNKFLEKKASEKNSNIAEDNDLNYLRFSILAAGDKNYPKFCEAGKQIHRLMCIVGAQSVVDLHLVDQEDDRVIESWIKACIQFMNKDCRNIINKTTRITEESNKSFSSNDFKPSEHENLQECENQDDYEPSEDDDITKEYGNEPNLPFWAKVKNKRELCRFQSAFNFDKSVTHLDISLESSNVTYSPGDALGIWPRNNEEEVKEIMNILGYDDSSMIDLNKNISNRMPLKFLLSATSPLGNNCSEGVKTYDVKERKIAVSVFFALTYVFDIRNISREMFCFLKFTEEEAENKKGFHLLHLLQLIQKNKDDLLTKREEAESILNHLRLNIPRLYSIASSLLHLPNSVSICVALVHYNVNYNYTQGVVSGDIFSNVKVGDFLPVYIHRNEEFRMPEELHTPMIMIGPGTGFAPFRSFLFHLSKLEEQDKIIKRLRDQNLCHMLFFGCRNRNEDYIYEEDMKRFSENLVSLHVAFSREKNEKVYVQDLLRRESAAVYKRIQNNGNIYVCGDAKNMAKDVHEVLKEILMTHKSISQDEAENFLQDLAAQSRYQRDIW